MRKFRHGMLSIFMISLGVVVGALAAVFAFAGQASAAPLDSSPSSLTATTVTPTAQDIVHSVLSSAAGSVHVTATITTNPLVVSVSVQSSPKAGDSSVTTKVATGQSSTVVGKADPHTSAQAAVASPTSGVSKSKDVSTASDGAHEGSTSPSNAVDPAPSSDKAGNASQTGNTGKVSDTKGLTSQSTTATSSAGSTDPNNTNGAQSSGSSTGTAPTTGTTTGTTSTTGSASSTSANADKSASAGQTKGQSNDAGQGSAAGGSTAATTGVSDPVTTPATSAKVCAALNDAHALVASIGPKSVTVSNSACTTTTMTQKVPSATNLAATLIGSLPTAVPSSVGAPGSDPHLTGAATPSALSPVATDDAMHLITPQITLLPIVPSTPALRHSGSYQGVWRNKLNGGSMYAPPSSADARAHAASMGLATPQVPTTPSFPVDHPADTGLSGLSIGASASTGGGSASSSSSAAAVLPSFEFPATPWQVLYHQSFLMPSGVIVSPLASSLVS